MLENLKNDSGSKSGSVPKSSRHEVQSFSCFIIYSNSRYCIFIYVFKFSQSIVRDSISAYCTISSMDQASLPTCQSNKSRKSIYNYFHFRIPSKLMQIHFTHLTLFCYTVIYPYWPTHVETPIFQSVI